ncbi:hypothetical protein JXA48_00150 [Candidatus Woesearchaeota archaeon]|nr:hypothetical protein [Candidatus Woesearchaeota archaeon]
MKPLKINVDVDSSLRDTPQAICDVYKQYFDSNSLLTPDDITSYDLKETFPLIHSVSNFFNTYAIDLFLKAKPYPGASKLLQQLYQNHFVYLVTDQPEGKEKLTELWARANGIPYYEIHCTPHKELLEADVIIDDKPSTINNYKKVFPNATTILIKQRYNSLEGDFQISPDCLEDILPIITSISRR